MKFGESDRESRPAVSPLRVKWIFLVSGYATNQELAYRCRGRLLVRRGFLDIDPDPTAPAHLKKANVR